MKFHSGLSRLVAAPIAIAGVVLMSLLAGCGQRGPLYLPPQPGAPTTKPAPTPPSPPPAAAAQSGSSASK